MRSPLSCFSIAALVLLLGLAAGKKTRKIETAPLKQVVSEMETSFSKLQEMYDEAKVPIVKFDPEQLVLQLIELAEGAQIMIASTDGINQMAEYMPGTDDLIAEFEDINPLEDQPTDGLDEKSLKEREMLIAKRAEFLQAFADSYPGEPGESFRSRSRRALLSVKTGSIQTLHLLRSIVKTLKSGVDGVEAGVIPFVQAAQRAQELVSKFAEHGKRVLNIVNKFNASEPSNAVAASSSA